MIIKNNNYPFTNLLVEKNMVLYNGKQSRVGTRAFYNCSLLQSISFPNCRTIRDEAFNICTSLQSANFPNCSYIGSYAFRLCSSLQSVSFPNCNIIESRAFSRCTSLQSVNFPNCSIIGYYVFQGCTSLQSVSFPNCSSIGNYAFWSCFSLQSVYLLSTSVCTLAHSNAFNNTPLSLSTYLGYFGSIYVPSSLLTAYQTATNWTYYSSRFVGV